LFAATTRRTLGAAAAADCAGGEADGCCAAGAEAVTPKNSAVPMIL
jgi:hypothetical protein